MISGRLSATDYQCRSYNDIIRNSTILKAMFLR